MYTPKDTVDHVRNCPHHFDFPIYTKIHIFERPLYRGFQIMFARFSVKLVNVFRKENVNRVEPY